MDASNIEAAIDAAWEAREDITAQTTGEPRDAVEAALDGLDCGDFRVAEKTAADGPSISGSKRPSCCHSASTTCKSSRAAPGWQRHGTTRSRPSSPVGAKTGSPPPDFARYPGSIVRRSAYIAPGAVLMPSFVNLGARVGSGTMVDTWATVGSCAQIGENCHISGGAGIGGVLEPLQAGPVIIEDGCFVGARSEVAEGVIVEQGAVLSMGVYIGASTKIVDRATGEIHFGTVPAYSVVVPGALPGRALPDGSPGPSLYCAVIVKQVDAKTRAKTSINELLRD